MTNPLNENKPIKISRDGQELPLALGLKLTRMFDERADADGVPRPPPAGMPLAPMSITITEGRRQMSTKSKAQDL